MNNYPGRLGTQGGDSILSLDGRQDDESQDGKQEFGGVSASKINIQWTQNGAVKTKQLEHSSEVDSKDNNHIQIERQRQVAGQGSNHPINANTSNTNPNANVFKPKKSIRAGFEDVGIAATTRGETTKDSNKKYVNNGDRYKFLKYPEADSTSILFHSLQGDLMRKIHTIPEPNSKEKALPPLPVAIDANSLKEANLLDPAAATTSYQVNQIVQQPVPPASTARMDSNSVTDLSAFYYHAPEPSFLDRFGDAIWGIFTPKRPHFWMPDRDAPECALCSLEFDWPLVRRHHCRRCGDVFCSLCCSHTVDAIRVGVVTGGERGKVRICQTCFARGNLDPLN